MIPGINGIPLSYVVHKDEDPKDGLEYLTFMEWMIACAPLKGQYFEADSHHVHTLLTGFLPGELTENWIHSFAHYQDGCHDMITLHNPYAGKGNSTHDISDANPSLQEQACTPLQQLLGLYAKVVYHFPRRRQAPY